MGALKWIVLRCLGRYDVTIIPLVPNSHSSWLFSQLLSSDSETMGRWSTTDDHWPRNRALEATVGMVGHRGHALCIGRAVNRSYRARAAERQIAFNDSAKLTLESDISADLQKPEFERVRGCWCLLPTGKELVNIS